jgi:hypothetical protein
MRIVFFGPVVAVLLFACGGGGGGGGTIPAPMPSQSPGIYQPLAAGDSWSYQCHDITNPGVPKFPIANSVVGTTSVGAQAVVEFSVQIPSSPTQSVTEIQLLADDAQGNTTIYGYLVGGAVQTIAPATIVSANPSVSGNYDYTAPDGSTVTRLFVGFEHSNPTPLGTFVVAPYFESGKTHNYGYASGTGIVEEDHGPNFQYDCLIQSVSLH